MISVLGKPPGMAAVKTIGYMPQDIALVGEFTIKGALQHFGWIFGMTDEQIDAKHRFLEELLDLPSAEKYIKNLRLVLFFFKRLTINKTQFTKDLF